MWMFAPSRATVCQIQPCTRSCSGKDVKRPGTIVDSCSWNTTHINRGGAQRGRSAASKLVVRLYPRAAQVGRRSALADRIPSLSGIAGRQTTCRCKRAIGLRSTTARSKTAGRRSLQVEMTIRGIRAKARDYRPTSRAASPRRCLEPAFQCPGEAHCCRNRRRQVRRRATLQSVAPEKAGEVEPMKCTSSDRDVNCPSRKRG